MLLTPEQYADLMAPPVSHRQANIQFLGQRLFYWEWGVIPYEMAPNFSDAERLRIRAAMDTWQRVAPVTFVARTTQTGFLAVTRDEVAGSADRLTVLRVGRSPIGRDGTNQPRRDLQQLEHHDPS